MRCILMPVSVTVFALALAGCSAADDDPAGGTSDGGSADGTLTMEPGKWANTTVIESFEVPGAPPELEQILKQMVGQKQSSESCMTQDDIAEGFERQAKEAVDGDACTAEGFSAKDGKLTGSVTCEETNGAGATMNIDGSYTSTSMNMTMTANIADPSMPGGTGKMVMKMTGERVGDCDT